MSKIVEQVVFKDGHSEPIIGWLLTSGGYLGVRTESGVYSTKRNVLETDSVISETEVPIRYDEESQMWLRDYMVDRIELLKGT